MIPPAKKRYVINFPGHMADCEYNYRRLRRLMPDWRVCPIGDQTEHHPHTGCDATATLLGFDETRTPRWHYQAGQTGHELAVTIQLLQAEKYTTTIRMAVHSSLTYTNYSLDARLYHDATLAEVIACQGRRGFLPKYADQNPDMYQPDEKAQLNHFFGELLEFCLVEGRVQRKIIITDPDSVATR